MTLTIQQITAEATLDLRQRVLWPQLPRAELILAQDTHALHFGAVRNGKIIATGSFFPDGQPGVIQHRLRKMAVDPDFQGQGIARVLIETAAHAIKATGSTAIWCDARFSAIGFYQKCGFDVETQVFQKQGVDYVKARRAL